jgi:hypothetical protein
VRKGQPVSVWDRWLVGPLLLGLVLAYFFSGVRGWIRRYPGQGVRDRVIQGSPPEQR